MGRGITKFFFLLFFIGSISVLAQENDDLYYTKADREKDKTQKREYAADWQASQFPEDATPAEQQDEVRGEGFEATSFLGKQYEYASDGESDGVVSQEIIDSYKSGKTIESYTSGTNQQSYLSENEPITSDFSNANFSDPLDTYQNDPVIINNYYNDNGWNNWNRPRWNFGFGWNNWGGNFWNVSYGWGGWYDPFWDPFWGANSGWNAGWGWNSWAWNGWGWRGGFWGNAWCPPYYGGAFNRPIYVVSDTRYRRNIVSTPRNTRGGAVRSSRRSQRVDGVVADQRSSRRDYARQQRDYLNQSRSSRYSENSSSARTARSSSTVRSSSSSRSSTGSVNQGSSSRSTNNYTGTTSRTSRSTRSSSSGYSRPSSSSRSSGYSRPSSSSSRSRSSGAVRSSSSRSSSSGRSSRSSGRSSSSRSSSRRGN